jgi:hypothetical protein
MIDPDPLAAVMPVSNRIDPLGMARMMSWSGSVPPKFQVTGRETPLQASDRV